MRLERERDEIMELLEGGRGETGEKGGRKNGLNGRTDRDWRGKARKLWKFSGGMRRKKRKRGVRRKG